MRVTRTQSKTRTLLQNRGGADCMLLFGSLGQFVFFMKPIYKHFKASLSMTMEAAILGKYACIVCMAWCGGGRGLQSQRSILSKVPGYQPQILSLTLRSMLCHSNMHTHQYVVILIIEYQPHASISTYAEKKLPVGLVCVVSAVTAPPISPLCSGTSILCCFSSGCDTCLKSCF